MAEEIPALAPDPSLCQRPAESSTHGYWGPLPGESPELYRALGVPKIEKMILRIPKFWRGEFNIEAGRNLEIRARREVVMPPVELTREERLERFVHFTQKNEAIHLGAFAVLGAINVASALEGSWLSISCAAVFGAANIIANIHPYSSRDTIGFAHTVCWAGLAIRLQP